MCDSLSWADVCTSGTGIVQRQESFSAEAECLAKYRARQPKSNQSDTECYKVITLLHFHWNTGTGNRTNRRHFGLDTLIRLWTCLMCEGINCSTSFTITLTFFLQHVSMVFVKVRGTIVKDHITISAIKCFSNCTMTICFLRNQLLN